MRFSLKLGCLGVWVAVTVASAQSPIAQSLISGIVVDSAASPLSNATVRLRNLQTNQIERVATANQAGEFSFVAMPEVPYVVEIADSAGRVVAVSDVITARAGEVAGAVVSIPTRLPAVTGVFADTAGSVVSAAASLGVTVVEATVLPLVSPER